ncbi:hypothetical protein Ancab_027632 [Ancistrocladus abbreviatus]
MLLYLPIRRYVLRKEFRSRKLYVTPNSIVYKAVLTRLANVRTEAFSRQTSAIEDVSNLRISQPKAALLSPSKSFRHGFVPQSGELILLQKLEEVRASIKRAQTLIEGQNSEAAQTMD